jgi:Fic family protein
MDGLKHQVEIMFDLHLWDAWNGVKEGQEVQGQMDDYFSWLQGALHSEQDVIEIATEAYVKFVKIHPYLDANDRTAWLIMNWILLRNGYSAFYVTAVNQADYEAIGSIIMQAPLSESIAAYKHWFREAYPYQLRAISVSPLWPRRVRQAA